MHIMPMITICLDAWFFYSPKNLLEHYNIHYTLPEIKWMIK